MKPQEEQSLAKTDPTLHYSLFGLVNLDEFAQMGGLLTVIEYMQNDEPGGDSGELSERRSQGPAGGGDAQCIPCRSGATVSVCRVSAAQSSGQSAVDEGFVFPIFEVATAVRVRTWCDQFTVLPQPRLSDRGISGFW